MAKITSFRTYLFRLFVPLILLISTLLLSAAFGIIYTSLERVQEDHLKMAISRDLLHLRAKLQQWDQQIFSLERVVKNDPEAKWPELLKGQPQFDVAVYGQDMSLIYGTGLWPKIIDRASLVWKQGEVFWAEGRELRYAKMVLLGPEKLYVLVFHLHPWAFIPKDVAHDAQIATEIIWNKNNFINLPGPFLWAAKGKIIHASLGEIEIIKKTPRSVMGNFVWDHKEIFFLFLFFSLLLFAAFIFFLSSRFETLRKKFEYQLTHADTIVPLFPVRGLNQLMEKFIQQKSGLESENKKMSESLELKSDELRKLGDLLDLEMSDREMAQNDLVFFKTALDNFCGTLAIDEMGFVVTCNRLMENLIKINVNSEQTLFDHLLVHPKELVLIKHQLEKEKKWLGELACLDKNKEPFWLEALILPFGAGMVLFGSDITMRKKFEAELLIARNEALSGTMAKSQFLATMGHEIRTPLNGIIGMLQLLENLEDPLKQRERILIMKKSADTLLTILNDILDFSKIEAGKIDLEIISFDLYELCARNISLFEGQAHEKGLEIKLVSDFNKSIYVQGDPTRVGQIIQNLLSNALKFTKQGHLLLHLNHQRENDGQDWWSISVEDSGTGIKEDDLSKLFQSFSQVDGSIARRYGGTGLGLAIAKNLSQIMGGDLSVTSQLGTGSTFTLRIPMPFVKPIVSKVETKNVIEYYKDKNIRPLKVLVVDDNQINLIVAQNLVKMLGLEADICVSGEECLEIISKVRYDLVLLDIQMPGMDGLETSRKMREKYGKNGPVILALSANSSVGDRQEALNSGMDEYLVKPLRLEELAQVLVRLFADEVKNFSVVNK